MRELGRAPGRGAAGPGGRDAAGRRDSLVPGKTTLVERHDAGEVRGAAVSGVSGAGGVLPYANQIQAAFGPAHDISSIFAHVGGPAAAATERMGATAYATGPHVAFREPPSLHTVAHEAAHVVQQRAGVQLLAGVGQEDDGYERNADDVADRVVAGRSAADLLPAGGGRVAAAGAVQLRRLPASTGELLADPAGATTPGANYAAHATGMKLLIERAETELVPAQKAQVQAAMLGVQSVEAFHSLPEPERLMRQSSAITKVRPDLTLGDPKLINARLGSGDPKVKKLADNATAIFHQIASGTYDKDVGEVFGEVNVATAKKNYHAAKFAMGLLVEGHNVVTDRSGYSEEVSQGGLTFFMRQIALNRSYLDDPDGKESIITMIHEAMHAGNSDVVDEGYVGEPSFPRLSEAKKLDNAAHFEVVPRRILQAPPTFVGVPFVPKDTPAGSATAPELTPAGSVTAPKLTSAEEALDGASATVRKACINALNLHNTYTVLYKDPTGWNATPARTFLRWWSKVEQLTIHLKTVIDPTSKDAAQLPLSQIDLALSEGVTRKLVCALQGVPINTAKAAELEAAHATEPERTAAHASVEQHKRFLIKLLLKDPRVAPITGDVDRDVLVVYELAKLNWNVPETRQPEEFRD